MDKNGAAMLKAQLSEQALHDEIIPVGIDPQMTALTESPADAEGTDPFLGPVPRDAVHNAVGTGIPPGPVRDLPVGGLDVRPLGKKEGADDPARIAETDIAAAFPDILTDQGLRRPAGRPPLIRIAVGSHEGAGKGVDLHHPGYILLH